MFAPHACRSVTETIPCRLASYALLRRRSGPAGLAIPATASFPLIERPVWAALRGFRPRAKLPLSAPSAAGPAPRRLRFRLACGYILRKLK
jgi:hypothetical protein